VLDWHGGHESEIEMIFNDATKEMIVHICDVDEYQQITVQAGRVLGEIQRAESAENRAVKAEKERDELARQVAQGKRRVEFLESRYIELAPKLEQAQRDLSEYRAEIERLTRIEMTK